MNSIKLIKPKYQLRVTAQVWGVGESEHVPSGFPLRCLGLWLQLGEAFGVLCGLLGQFIQSLSGSESKACFLDSEAN